MMKKILVVLLLLVSGYVMAQPSNYVPYQSRNRYIALMADSTFHIPRFNGSPSLRTGGSTNDGALAADTANGRLYMYYNGSWGLVNKDTANTFLNSLYKKTGTDSIFQIKGGTHSFVFTVGSGYGSSIDTTSLSNRINLKLNISDTAAMLTNYVRAKRLSDTASAIRSAFPKFGTSTDNTATGARSFNANANNFSFVNLGYSGSGLFSGSDANPASNDAGAYHGFIDETDGLTGSVMGLKTSSGINSRIAIATGTGKGDIKITEDDGDGVINEILLRPSGIYIKPNLGHLYIDTLQVVDSADFTDNGGRFVVTVGDVVGSMSNTSFLTTANGVPSTRTLTINGISYDLSANRSWTINGDFYTLDGTFSSNRRANLDGYRLTFDSGQVRYRDTMTSSTGKLYGMISDYGRAGVEHINYDSLTTAYHSVNTVTGVKFGVKDQNNLDTNNYIQADASGAYAVTGAVSTSDSSNKIATTKWVKQLGLSGGSVTNIYNSDGTISGNRTIDADGYDITINSANHVAIGADSIQLALNQGVLRFSGLNDGGQSSDSIMSIDAYGLIRKRYLQNATSTKDGLMSKEDKARLDSNSYLLNPAHPDSLLFQKNDSVMQVKSVTVESQLPDVYVNTIRTDTTIKHQLVKLNISEPIISFTAGAGFAADTTVFTDSTLYGSFYTGQDSFYVTKAFAVIKGQSGDTLGMQIVYNDTFNVTGTVVGGGTLAVNNRTTGNSFDISTNSGIPPNMWVWLKSPTVVAGKKPEYLSVTLIGYRRYVAP